MALIEDRPNRIAILIPCCNEDLTLTQVIQDFKEQVPKYFSVTTTVQQMIA
jgi:hypothetical protein